LPEQVCPLVRHGVTQAPAVQFWPVAHAWLHVPQLAVSVCRLRQVPAQQVWPVAQAWPHAPQWASSVCRLRQVPAQAVCPEGQLQTGLDEPPQVSPELQRAL
jgi:hypothetical protein